LPPPQRLGVGEPPGEEPGCAAWGRRKRDVSARRDRVPDDASRERYDAAIPAAGAVYAKAMLDLTELALSEGLEAPHGSCTSRARG
jgi:hypothetical protein